MIMISVLARLNGTTEPTVDVSVDTTRLPDEDMTHLAVIEQAQCSLKMQRTVGYEQVPMPPDLEKAAITSAAAPSSSCTPSARKRRINAPARTAHARRRTYR